MSSPTIELIWDAKNELGEGPVWDSREQKLYWLDSKGPTINRYDPRNGSVQTWKLPSDVGSMALREKGGAIVALRDGIFGFDFDTGKTELMVAVEADNPRTRLNDGKVDRRGRFFVGGMDEQETGRMAGLYRFDPDHTLVKLDGGIVCFNMPCWSPDDKVFYFAETWNTFSLATMTSRPARFPTSAPSSICEIIPVVRMAPPLTRRAIFGTRR